MGSSEDLYECTLKNYKPYLIGTNRDRYLFRGRKCIPLMWIRTKLDTDEVRLNKPVSLCTHVAFERPECVPCRTIPLDVNNISPVLVESTCKYSVLYKKNIKCNICNNYPM